MYFEKICKINNNGNLSGYHKRGKKQADGTIKYFVNDRFGNEDDLKALESQHHFWNIFEPLDTYLNPKYFKVPAIDHKTLPDHEFINYCQTKQQNDVYLQRHKEIKEAIRNRLHQQLDANDAVDETTLKDFKFAVQHEKQTHEDESIINIWKNLYALYVGEDMNVTCAVD